MLGWLKLGSYVGVVVGLMWIGNAYGPNAFWRAHREAEDRARNAVLTDLAERQDAAGQVEDAMHVGADAEFDELYPGLEKYPLPATSAAALNVVREVR